MAADLPTSGAITDSQVTNAQQKINFSALFTYLLNLFGDDSSAKKEARRIMGVQPDILPISGTVAGGSLTVTVQPSTRSFRSTTQGDGTVVDVASAAAISCVVPNGATLGLVNGSVGCIAVLEINNAGTKEVAVVNVAGGVNLDESTLLTTTTLSAASDLATVVYSTTSRANVPFRVAGYIYPALDTPGSWANPPTKVQGAGGIAAAGLAGAGYGQTPKSVIGGRSIGGGPYYNPSPRPMDVAINSYGASSAVGNIWQVNINGVGWGISNEAHRTNGPLVLSFTVPAFGFYAVVNLVGATTATGWNENS